MVTNCSSITIEAIEIIAIEISLLTHDIDHWNTNIDRYWNTIIDQSWLYDRYIDQAY